MPSSLLRVYSLVLSLPAGLSQGLGPVSAAAAEVEAAPALSQGLRGGGLGCEHKPSQPQAEARKVKPSVCKGAPGALPAMQQLCPYHPSLCLSALTFPRDCLARRDMQGVLFLGHRSLVRLCLELFR